MMMVKTDKAISFSRYVSLFSIFGLMALSSSAISQDQEASGLISQVQSLQNKSGIEIVGLEKIQEDVKTATSGNLDQQIKQLFAAYNHIAVRSKKGTIEKIVIINKKQKSKSDDRIVLPATVQGSHFMVDVALSGDGKVWQNLTMLIDTGADLVVLPESLIDQIGMSGSTFTQAKMQTANGTADAKIGLLKEVKIAGETVENVEAAFVADALLGENKLLGMSVLGRYQLNMDDKNQLVTLIRK